jgi:hypothetical protein
VGTAEQIHYNFSAAPEIEEKLIHFAQKDKKQASRFEGAAVFLL